MRWGYAITAPPQVNFAQGSTILSLGDQITDILVNRIAAGNREITACELMGAGDGHSFMLAIEHCQSGQSISILSAQSVPTAFTPIIYIASNLLELELQRTGAYGGITAFPANTGIIGSVAAGSSNGLRFCRMEFVGLFTPA